ncbi:MAG: class I poly(R)-hydroxyalkanoic acid synthase [Alphaproteobacteria bacterium]
MTIADDDQNPKMSKKLAKSLDAIAALRIAMEQRLAENPKHEESKPQVSEPDPEPTPEVTPPEPEVFQAQPETIKSGSEEKPKAPQADPQSAHHIYDPAEWSRIMMRIAERSQKLIQDYVERNKGKSISIPTLDPAHLMDAFSHLSNHVLHDPERFVNAQVALWQGYTKVWQSVLDRVQGKPSDPVVMPNKGDKRFKDQEWNSNWLFDYMKQSYLLTAQWVHGLVQLESKDMDPRQTRKLEFYTRQMLDALSPNNFWLTNPEVLRTTFETHGENLIKGLENLLADLERGHGKLSIKMTDTQAFAVGDNIATTPGKVIYQNTLMQLIQYEPQTAEVHKTPLLIVPPWINKFYILDLSQKNSMIQYLVKQGHTVFCISWVNPDKRHAATNFDDYMNDGILASMHEIRRLTSEDNINVLGYCIGGTLLAATLAYLKAMPQPRPGLPKVVSATYLVTMVDFSDPGDLGVFIDPDQVKLIEENMAQRGYFEASSMVTTFNMLRANDLIWSFVINNYLLGKEPFPFDILYWNGDSTNLPAAMHSYYLHNMYLDNLLCQPGGIKMKSVPIDVRQIDTPSFILSTSEDHIAPWKSTYAATQLYKGPMTFVLSGSGHVAGVINSPQVNKYGYWTNTNLPADPEEWLATAKQQKGSWWPEWLSWLKPHAGEKVPARQIAHAIENAPGSYVKVRAV